jgi:hypothetical protein
MATVAGGADVVLAIVALMRQWPRSSWRALRIDEDEY